MLTSVIRKDSFPIPNIVELLSYLQKSKIFTSLDLPQTFHFIPVCEIGKNFPFAHLTNLTSFVKCHLV